MKLQEFTPHFDTYLNTRLEEKLISVKWLFPDTQTFELITYLKPYVDHGKRFRPYMVYVWYTLYGWEDLEYITKVGLIHELIHIFALIHDDICDQGTMRHKIPSYHQELSKKYNNDHFGQAQAMLVGDLVYTWAMHEAQKLLSGKDAHNIVFEMLNEVVIGQMLDVDYSTSQEWLRSAEAIATKDHLKSGQYTFQKPMMVWASLAGIQDLAKVEQLWKNIWVAFQMRDDLLDWIPNQEWKTKMSDIQEGNQTIVMITCHEEYDEQAWKRLRENKGKKLSALEIEVLHEDFETFSIKQKVLTKIHSLLDTVEQDFISLQASWECYECFLDVIQMLREV